jgi:hypothetical protein
MLPSKSHSRAVIHSPKAWLWPRIQSLSLELNRERMRKALQEVICTTEVYVRSCKMEIYDLSLASSTEEPIDGADHRANLTEFLRDEITLSLQHGTMEHRRIHDLECSAVLPLLAPSPGLSERSFMRTAERTTAPAVLFRDVRGHMIFAEEGLALTLGR